MIFELLFLALLLASSIALIGVLILVVLGKRRAGMRMLLAFVVGWAGYLLIVALVSAATPQRIVPMGQERCFDEMCFAVVHAETASQLGLESQAAHANGRFYIVTVRVSSRSRGRAQSEAGLRAMLWDAGKSYEVSLEGQSAWEEANGETASLTARLQPGESITSVQVFDLPVQSTAPGLVLSHGFTPGYFVIGESPILRKPTLMRIEP
ncbi:MAG TPA: hypothetical protein VGT08_08005 [Terracidiphilus sp.]|nr:hypothetical protein [Terracidiphilus sp.]